MNCDQNDGINLERRHDLRHDEEFFRLSQEEKFLGNARRRNTFIWIVNSICWLADMPQILLIIRFYLHLLGTNSENTFTRLINSLSALFITLFSTLFICPTLINDINIFRYEYCDCDHRLWSLELSASFDNFKLCFSGT